jgi:hypothetical protein
MQVSRTTALVLAAALMVGVGLVGCKKDQQQEGAAPAEGTGLRPTLPPTTGTMPALAPSLLLRGPVTMPAGTLIQANTFEATGDARFLVGRMSVFVQAGTNQVGRSQPQFFGIDMTRGGLIPIAQLLPQDVRKAETMVLKADICPVARQMLVTFATKPGQMFLMLVDIDSGGSVMLAGGTVVEAAWVGDTIAMIAADEQGNISPLTLARVGAQPRQLDMRVVPLAASMDGSVLIAAGDPKDLKRAINVNDFQNLTVMALGPDGKLLREIGPVGIFGHREDLMKLNVGLIALENIMVSPFGKHVAYQQRPTQSEPRYTLQVKGTAGADDESYATSALPLALNDAKQVVAITNNLVEQGWIKIFNPGGESPVIVDGVQAATVVSNAMILLDRSVQPMMLLAPLPAIPAGPSTAPAPMMLPGAGTTTAPAPTTAPTNLPTTVPSALPAAK